MILRDGVATEVDFVDRMRWLSMGEGDMDYSFFIDNAPYEDVKNELSRLVLEEGQDSIDAIAFFLTHKSHDTEGKHFIPRLACRALIQKGPRGIEALKALINEADGFIYPSTIINSIWYASNGDLLQLRTFDKGVDPVLDRPLDENAVFAAKEAFHDVVVSCLDNQDLFITLIGALQQQTFFSSDTSGVITAVIKTIADSSISITGKKLVEFAELIEAEKREEAYQMFFEENPVFLNPLASRIIDKQRLGDDLITDFVVQTLENKYIMVEIEKPQDRIFNQNNDFSSAFTHAYGQVLDFLSWVDENVAYAQKKLPGVVVPNGMLIIGRSTILTEPQRRKLDYFNSTNQRIIVYTYDDILSNANRLYRNMVYHEENAIDERSG